MSHIVTIHTELRDPLAIAAGCRRLHLPEPVYGTHSLFNSSASGWAVQLLDWHYPIFCDTTRGQILFDNFNGRWGESAELQTFQQAYACEKAKLEAHRRGHSVTEQSLADGSIKLTIAVEGGSA
jgi:hypothetical protein